MSNTPTFGQILPGVRYTDRPGAYAFLTNADGELAIVATSVGFFLPGGGVEPGESLEDALARELLEELGLELTRHTLVCKAVQYHISEFYREAFKKIGCFFKVEARIQPGALIHPGHTLVWWPVEKAKRELSQEFQRWAVAQIPA